TSRDGSTARRPGSAKGARGGGTAPAGNRARRATGERTDQGAGREIRPGAPKRARKSGVSTDGRGAGQFRKTDGPNQCPHLRGHQEGRREPDHYAWIGTRDWGLGPRARSS